MHIPSKNDSSLPPIQQTKLLRHIVNELFVDGITLTFSSPFHNHFTRIHTIADTKRITSAAHCICAWITQQTGRTVTVVHAFRCRSVQCEQRHHLNSIGFRAVGSADGSFVCLVKDCRLANKLIWVSSMALKCYASVDNMGGVHLKTWDL